MSATTSNPAEYQITRNPTTNLPSIQIISTIIYSQPLGLNNVKRLCKALIYSRGPSVQSVRAVVLITDCLGINTRVENIYQKIQNVKTGNRKLPA